MQWITSIMPLIKYTPFALTHKKHFLEFLWPILRCQAIEYVSKIKWRSNTSGNDENSNEMKWRRISSIDSTAKMKCA